MSRDIVAPKEEKTKVPSYIVTFSDMITLLLTFFVLLLSMASERVEEAKFEIGRQAFIKSITNFGLDGIGYGKRPTLSPGDPATLHPVDKNEKSAEEASLDMTEETVRRIFEKLEKQMTITAAQIIGKSPDFRPMSIKFKKGGWVLNKPAQKYLETFSYELQQNIGSQSLTMYVVGLAQNEGSLEKQCLVSAKRAQAASDFLRKSLPEEVKWKIHSWGAGPGGQWKSSGPIEGSEVIVAILGD
jgi:flagellar motor protein MotB